MVKQMKEKMKSLRCSFAANGHYMGTVKLVIRCIQLRLYQTFPQRFPQYWKAAVNDKKQAQVI